MIAKYDAQNPKALRELLEETGYVFAGLGCPNGCDFCATSHYFKRRHIRFLPDGTVHVEPSPSR